MNAPIILHRTDLSYVAERWTGPLEQLGSAIAETIPRLYARLMQEGIAVCGPPLIRYVRIDMIRSVGVEFGFPVASPPRLPGDASLVAGTLPAGYYAVLEHRGPPDTLIDANARLRAWALDNKLALDVRRTGEVEHWAGRCEEQLAGPAEHVDAAEWLTRISYRLQQGSRG